MATYNGSSGNDTYTGTTQDDSISGNAGNDSLRGEGGNDTILGGPGDDSLDGGDGNDSILGGTGFDRMFGSAGNDFFDGGIVTDRFGYTDGNDIRYLDPMFDAAGVVIDFSGFGGDGSIGLGTVVKGAGGALGTDTIANVDFVRGSNGNDRVTLSGALIFEQIYGTLGNDTLDGGPVDNSFFQPNTNRLNYDTISGPVVLDLRAGTVSKPSGFDSIANFTQARGSAQNDTLYGSDDTIRHEEFDGRGGDDLIDGRGGFDMIRYDSVTNVGVSIRLGIATPQADGVGGFDVLHNIEGLIGSEQADSFTGDAQGNRLEGRGGNDTLEGGAGNDTLVGGGGLDAASYANAPSGVFADIQLGAASGGDGVDVLTEMDGLIGSAFDDRLIGSTIQNNLQGGAGNDSLFGAGGFDTLEGGPGNDTLDGGAIIDRAYYQDSNRVGYERASSGVVVDLSGLTGNGSTGSGTAQDGDGGTDTLRNINFVSGSPHNDRITGSSALQFEAFYGGLGNDTFDGGGDGDALQRDHNRVQYADASSPVTVNLGAGTASGAHGSDQLSRIHGVLSGSANDTLIGSDRSDRIEQFAGNSGADSIDGRGGIDFLRYDIGGAVAGITINLQVGTASDGDVFSGIEGAYGSSFGDTMIGRDGAADTFAGLAGNDSINGGSGSGDWVWYHFAPAAINVTLPGSGSSTGTDGYGNTDTFAGIEAVRGSIYADTLTGSDALQETFEGNAGNDTIDGRGNFDTASYEQSWNNGAVVDLGAGIASDDGFGNTDTLIGIENVTGTLLYGDRLTGSHSSNVIDGLGGNDTLFGLGGRDTFRAGTGVDSIDGGDDLDLLILSGNRADYTLSTPVSGSVRLVRAATGEDVTARSIEQFAFADQSVALGVLLGRFGNGTPQADTITGTPGDNDLIDGLAGDDSLIGDFGNDTLIGGAGDDTLVPGRPDLSGGADFVDGGDGSDTLRVAFARNQYGFINMGGGNARVFSGNTGETIFVSAVEFIAFSDQTVPLASVIGPVFDGLLPSEYADSLVGTNANESINALGGDDTVKGGAGNDTLIGGSGVDWLDGGAGTDLVSYAGAGSAVQLELASGTVAGGAGGDQLSGIENASGSGFGDVLVGDGGANLLAGLGGDDTLDGAAGDDTLDGGPGSDQLGGGAGSDTLDYSGATAGVTVTMTAAGAGSVSGGAGNDGFSGIEAVRGSNLADAITGSASSTESLDGGGGNDTLRGLAGADLLVGGDGNDLLEGGAGSDDLDAALRGANDDDTLIGGVGDDTLDGGSGFDWASYEAAPAAVTVDLAAATANDGQGGTDRLVSIEIVVGSSFDDRLAGDGHMNALVPGRGNDTVIGGGSDGAIGDVVIYDGANGAVLVNLAAGSGGGADQGSDTLIGIRAAIGSDFNDTVIGSSDADYLDGSAGNDSLAGGDGNDTLRGDSGNDTLDGGAGIDRATYSASGAAVSVSLASGSSSGNDGTDALLNIEELEGSPFNDTLTGDAGGNVIIGREGIDSLRGGGGDDMLFGGADRDTLRGDGGNDTLDGGLVTDRINYTDLNFAIYADESAAVRIDLSGVTGDGSSGFGMVTKPGGFTDRLINIDFFQGSAHADTIIGSSALVFEHFEGRAGNDTIDGGAITDPIFGRNGNRANYGNAPLAVMVDLAAGVATGGDGSDALININYLRSSAYNDTIFGSDRTFNHEHFEPLGGADTIDGRGGQDYVRYQDATAPVIASLATGIVEQDGYGYRDVLFNIEGLRGGLADDQLTGGNPANGTTAVSNRQTDGFERFEGGAGNDTLDGGIGFDWAVYFNSTGPVDVHLGGSADGSAQDGVGGSDVLRSIEAVWGSQFADRLTGSASGFYEIFNGRKGNDTIDGGDVNRSTVGAPDQFDVADYRNDEVQGIVADLRSGTVIDGFGDTDMLTGIEAIFGSFFADSVRGADQAENLRGDTLRGGEGNDTFDGGSGVDSAEFRGNRADYTLTSISGGRWSVRDDNSSVDGNDGTDTLSNVERLVFNDQMIAFGSRAEEIARVAFVLWTKGIVGSGALFSRGLSFYDGGYDFETMSVVALQFWTADSDTQLAQRLITNSGSTKTVAQLLQTMAANGSGVEGRGAALREIALDPATTTLIEQSHIREVGLVASNSVPGFGTLFDLLGG